MELDVLRPAQVKEQQRFKKILFKGLNQCLLTLRIEYIRLKSSNFRSFFVVSLLGKVKNEYAFWPNTFNSLNDLKSFLNEFLRSYQVHLDFLQEIHHGNSIHTLSTKAAAGARCGETVSNGDKKLERF